MRRTVRIVLALFALSAIVAPAALAAERMWVGFHDDPSFRWAENRATRIESTADERVDDHPAPRPLEPSSRSGARRAPTDPFDPAYNFGDIDEAVRTAQAQDLEVMLTISGTPRLGERRQEAERDAEAPLRLQGVLAGDRVALLGARTTASRSSASGRSGTSRT